MLALGDIEKQSHPSLVGHTNELEALYGIQDLLLALTFKGSGKPPPSLPRPQTALERVERHQLSQKHNAVLGQLLPGRH